MAVPATTSSTSTNYTPSTTNSTTATSPTKTLNQDDFLKLLVAQLSSQDPLSPVSNTDFLAQMAQFSTLQQTQTMQTDLAGIQSGQAVLQANSLLGRVVQVQDAAGLITTGVVSSIGVKGGSPTLIVKGQTYDLSQVISVSALQVSTPTSANTKNL